MPLYIPNCHSPPFLAQTNLLHLIRSSMYRYQIATQSCKNSCRRAPHSKNIADFNLVPYEPTGSQRFQSESIQLEAKQGKMHEPSEARDGYQKEGRGQRKGEGDEKRVA